MPSHRLVKIELDAAEALAEFSRLAHLPCQTLKWLRKRKRSTRAYSDVADEVKAPDVSHTYAKNLNQSPISEKEEHESYTEVAEESHSFYSRAESPSSPLPSLQLSCNRNGDSNVKSGVQAECPLPPVMSSCLRPHKTKTAEIRLSTMVTKAKKVSIRRNSRGSCKSSLLLSAVKTEPLHEPEIGIKNLKNARNGELDLSKPQVKCLLNVASNESGVTQEVNFEDINKPKTLLTDTEKEARRLRRIQANRESARQTIRRKQILCEELTRKATTLAAENEGMKQKKELLIQELHSLKNKNCQLKHQLGINNSDNSELGSLEIESMCSSLAIDTTVLQAPTNLPLRRVPGQSVVWGMPVPQTIQVHNNKPTDGKVGTPTNDKVANGNDGPEASVSEIHASNETAASEVAEQKSSQTFGRSCTTGSTYLSRKEADTIDAACESYILDHASKDVAQTLQENAGNQLPFHVRNLSLPLHGTVFVKQHRCDDTTIVPEETEQYIIPALPMALRYGFPYNCDRDMSIKGFFPAHMYIGRKSYVTALAAAEARKRRKELTRSKFPRIRPFRLQQSR